MELREYLIFLGMYTGLSFCLILLILHKTGKHHSRVFWVLVTGSFATGALSPVMISYLGLWLSLLILALLAMIFTGITAVRSGREEVFVPTRSIPPASIPIMAANDSMIADELPPSIEKEWQDEVSVSLEAISHSDPPVMSLDDDIKDDFLQDEPAVHSEINTEGYSTKISVKPTTLADHMEDEDQIVYNFDDDELDEENPPLPTATDEPFGDEEQLDDLEWNFVDDGD